MPTSGAPARNPALAPRTAEIYDPPDVAPIPFDLLYPQGVAADAAGRPLYSIYGDPIAPEAAIVGRQMVGGNAIPYPPEGLDALAAATTGRSIAVLPVGHTEWGIRGVELPADAAGATWLGPSRLPELVAVADDLAPSSVSLVAGHEGGHALDLASSYGQGLRSSSDQVEGQLRRIYNDLGNPDPAHRGADVWGVGNPAQQSVVSPETFGYGPADVDAELWAEAYRAALANPDYVLTVAPDVYRIIPQTVARHPELSRFIHFNASGVPLPGGQTPGYFENAPFDLAPPGSVASPTLVMPQSQGPFYLGALLGVPPHSPTLGNLLGSPGAPRIGDPVDQMWPYYRPPPPPPRPRATII